MEKAHVELHGRKFPLVGPGEFTLGELCDCEIHFGASFGDATMDARKLASVLYISVRRVDATVQVDDVRNLTGDQLARVGENLQRWQQEGDDGPPAQQPGGDAAPSASNGSSGDSSTVDSEESADAPSPTGHLHSVTGAA